MKISVVIPARDEEASIGQVLAAIPAALVADVIVVDNGSRDTTAKVARGGGARVVGEPHPGYGRACLRGLQALRDAADGPPEVVVFLDADYSDHPEEMPSVLGPIRDDRADLVVGSRALGRHEPGALLPQARFGNWLACRLIRWLFGHRYTDLGPFRAIRWTSLQTLGMRDPTFGWTVEMQVKALIHGLRVAEIPVSYRRRVGVSKITGTVSGTIKAGWKIITMILVLRWRSWRGAMTRRSRLEPVAGRCGPSAGGCRQASADGGAGRGAGRGDPHGE